MNKKNSIINLWREVGRLHKQIHYLNKRMDRHEQHPSQSKPCSLHDWVLDDLQMYDGVFMHCPRCGEKKELPAPCHHVWSDWTYINRDREGSLCVKCGKPKYRAAP